MHELKTDQVSELSTLVSRAALPLIDVRDDVTEHVKDVKARDRILRNLKSIQELIQEVPRDMRRIAKGESISAYEYEWPQHG